jgi:hypothetical protein
MFKEDQRLSHAEISYKGPPMHLFASYVLFLKLSDSDSESENEGVNCRGKSCGKTVENPAKKAQKEKIPKCISRSTACSSSSRLHGRLLLQ